MDKRVHTPWRNEELALHVVTSHCRDGRRGLLRQGVHDQQGNTGETSTHITQVGSKMKPSTTGGPHGEVRDSNTTPWRMPAPCGRCRVMQNSEGGAAKAQVG